MPKRIVVSGLFSLVTLLFSCTNIPDFEVNCSDGVDDDRDDFVDCSDSDCTSDPACLLGSEQNCTDQADDDGDGLIDCEDSDCINDSACIEVCDDGVDNDGDGAVDCLDSDCLESASCVEDCDDDVDNDGDGTIDCADPDCVESTDCTEDCSDGLDNDEDNAVDCLDSDCTEAAHCFESNCTDNQDNEALPDGDIDCEDADCAADPACQCPGFELGSSEGVDLVIGDTFYAADLFPETLSCSSQTAPSSDVNFTWTAPRDDCFAFSTLAGAGSDFDTLLQLYNYCPSDGGAQLAYNDDPVGTFSSPSRLEYDAILGESLTIVINECGSAAGNFSLSIGACNETSCSDGTDEDGDGWEDCLDTDCYQGPDCPFERGCEDGIDNDGDGVTDCADLDCAAVLSCNSPCSASDLGSATGMVVAMGSTVGAGNDQRMNPSSGLLGWGEDVNHLWTAPTSECYRFDTTGSEFQNELLVMEQGGIGSFICNGVPWNDQDWTTAQGSNGGHTAIVQVETIEGQPYVIRVDSPLEGFGGVYRLNINPHAGPCMETACNDGMDEDGDGNADCDDYDCQTDPNCVESCADGIDNDGDGLTDCLDPNCSSSEDCVEICDDGLDNDGDGDVDCLDSACSQDPNCIEDCSDGVDNDGDGDTDCDDSNCTLQCLNAEVCDDGVDNDGDNLVDCLDSNCRNYTGCYEDSCTDGIDNDSDGDVDCLDSDCGSAIFCSGEVACANGQDDDGDGSSDCADSDCVANPACIGLETDCADGVDNDGDGDVDCNDLSCVLDSDCGRCPSVDFITGSPMALGAVAGPPGQPYQALDDYLNFSFLVDDIPASFYSCTAQPNSTSGEAFFTWTAPTPGCYQIDLEEADTLSPRVFIASIVEGACDSILNPQLACAQVPTGATSNLLVDASATTTQDFTIIAQGVVSLDMYITEVVANGPCP